MKKFITVLMSIVLVFSLVACGTSGGDSGKGDVANPDTVDLQKLAADYDGQITVTLWGKDSIGDSETSRGYLFNKMAEEYAAKFKNVTINYVFQGSYEEVAEKIMAAAAAKDLPTGFMAEEATVKGFTDIAADLNSYMTSTTIKNYQQGLLASMITDDGKLLAAPCARSLPVLYVNKELLAQAGWSGADIKTNDDLMKCAKEVFEKTGKYGLCCFWDTDVWHWESAVYADGGSVLSDDGSKATIGADYNYIGAHYLEMVQKGLNEGYIASPYGTAKPGDTRDDLFCSGKVAMMLVSCNSMPKRAQKLTEAGYTMETYVQPAGEGGVSIVSGGSNWMLCNTASYEELMIAAGFLSYLAEDAQVLRITNGTGSMMITTSAVNSDGGKALIEQYPYFQAIYDSIPYIHKRVNTSYWSEMSAYAADKLEQFSLNPATTDVKKVIDDISAKFDQIIKDNSWQ